MKVLLRIMLRDTAVCEDNLVKQALSDQCQAVFRGHASRSMWNADLRLHNGRCKRRGATGQACACCHHVWETVPRDPDPSTARRARFCVKPTETGPDAITLCGTGER